jgi:uncharacterized peroxidase-related enzyme
MSYPVHTVDTAPAAARETLAGAKKSYGFVPNLLAVMAEAPALLKAYRTLSELFDQTSFNPSERQVVLLTASYENDCSYCVAAHSAVAGMQKVPADVIQAIRAGNPVPDPKLQALRRFTSVVVNTRGWPTETDLAAFQGAGYSRAQVLEVVLGVGMKTLSNYASHIADIPLDQAFAPAAWAKAA